MPPESKRKRGVNHNEDNSEYKGTDVEFLDRSVKSLRSSQSSAAVSDTTKQYLRARYEDRCWLCGLLGTDVAHVYPKADDAIVRALTPRLNPLLLSVAFTD